MQTTASAEAVVGVRAFNRFWTARAELLDAKLLDTTFNLTEARILFELSQVDRLDLWTLLQRLRVDAGYVSRLLKRLDTRGLIEVGVAPDDARRRVLSLTAIGRDAFADLDHRSTVQAEELLAPLDADEVGGLLTAMSTIQRAMGGDEREAPSSDRPAALGGPVTAAREVTLRGLRPGDLGWVIGRHGALYAAEYGWDLSFEALVARIVADFASDHDPSRERAWIADVGGAPAGCVFCVAAASGEPETAQLRILLVEPSARGLGLGSTLVRACLDFARDAGYRRIVLWTNDVLTAARRIYEREGFTLISEEPHTSFGHDLTGQYWARDL